MIYTAKYDSPVGGISIAESDGAIISLRIDGQRPCRGIEDAAEADTPALAKARSWLDRYFAGERMTPDGLELAPNGSEFRKLVWELLLEIPYGETTTYGELAKKAAARMGVAKMSAQAVGGAVGHNPISIIIPCHRVIGADGSMTGYDGGIAIKEKLLRLEGVK